MDARVQKTSFAGNAAMNPFFGETGKWFDGEIGERLLTAMRENDWPDGRFLLAKQIESLGGMLKPQAKAVVVEMMTAGGTPIKVPLFNAEETVNLPSMGEMYSAIAALPTPVHGRMVLDGEPFDAYSEDPYSLQKSAAARDTLMEVMAERGWTDPRFVRAAVVEARQWNVLDNDPVMVDDVKLYNAAQVDQFPELPDLARWQEMAYTDAMLSKEKRKAQDMAAMEAETAETTKEAPQAMDEPVRAPLTPDMQEIVFSAAKDVGLSLNRDKVEHLLATGMLAENGMYVGCVAAVLEPHGNAEAALVIQSQGRGKGEVFPLAALSNHISPKDIGRVLTVHVRNGKGLILMRDADQAQEKDLGR